MKKTFKISLFLVALAISVAFGASSSLTAPPNDQYFNQQWSLHNDGTQTVMIEVDGQSGIHTTAQQAIAGVDIGWLDAQSSLQASANAPVVVAVIDTGIDPTHPDLQGRIAPNGYDFLAASPTPTDDMGHGTHVSGMIAAATGNQTGIAGIAPQSVTVLPLKILSSNFTGFSYNGKLVGDYAADAINYAVAHHASVINMSLGWPKIVDTVNAQNAVQNAIKAGVLVVVAAGNDQKDQPTYPCAYSGVLCVGSVTNTGAMSIYSNIGGQVDVLAPGDGIVSTFPMNIESQYLRIQGYELLSGTSQASPEVAAIAATLKSANPQMPASEIKARILSSAAPIPTQNSALYGMANLNAALTAQPKPVFLPNFKGTNEYVVDESTLTIQGQVSVSNLWQTATSVKVQAMVNGKPAGSAQAPALAQNQAITVPWSYKFSSLDEASDIPLSISVTDAQGDAKTFAVSITALRSTDQMLGLDKNQKTINPPNVSASQWLGSNYGILSTSLKTVNSYGESTGLTRYYQQTGNSSSGCSVTLFDPTAANSVNSLQIPLIQNISQVSRIDVAGDGNMDWLIAGTGVTNGKPYFYFYFLNPSFQPLWGTSTASTWAMFIDQTNSSWQLPLRLYDTAGSWVRFSAADPKIYPAFLASGPLPAIDGFDELDSRHGRSENHFYYLGPVAHSPAGQPLQLQLRALDNAMFETQNPNIGLLSILPSDDEDQKAGHIRVLMENGSDLSAQVMTWDIPSISGASSSNAAGWDVISATGTPLAALSGGDPKSDAFLNFYDPERASLGWSSSQGQFIDRSDFQFNQAENLINGLVGAFDLGKSGRYWFIQTSFDLVAYHEDPAVGASSITSQTISLERDTSFASQTFSDMLMPVVVGTSAEPVAAVYVDSTLVRGDRVAVAVWNAAQAATSSEAGSLYKPLRYSFQVPAQCAELNPVQATAQIESFTIPFLCQNGNGVQYRLITPAQ